MEIAVVLNDGDSQMVRLPKQYHLPTRTVAVRRQGESVVLEPVKDRTWPPGFFEEIHITDPAFERPQQGKLPS